MDSNHPQHTTSIDKASSASVHNKLTADGNLILKQQQQQKQQQQLPPPVSVSTSTAASPPSSSSSPSHEFSFTISLHSSSSTTKAKAPPPSFAVDLTPADDIFFHGHLLPLHLLSHLTSSTSPRSSTHSSDGLSGSLPVECSSTSGGAINGDDQESRERRRRRSKSKSFWLLGLGRWRKEVEREGEDEEKEKENQKRKARFDLGQVVKRYVRMVQPLLMFKGLVRRDDNVEQLRRRHGYSFSANLAMRRNKPGIVRGSRGEFSAPASMRTSPTNSGLLSATSSVSDSTMEELQAAIQAAIAHCKNSIASHSDLHQLN